MPGSIRILNSILSLPSLVLVASSYGGIENFILMFAPLNKDHHATHHEGKVSTP